MVHVADVPALACSGSLRLFLFTEVSVPETQVSPSPPRHPEVPEGPSPRPDGCAVGADHVSQHLGVARIGLGARAPAGRAWPGRSGAGAMLPVDGRTGAFVAATGAASW